MNIQLKRKCEQLKEHSTQTVGSAQPVCIFLLRQDLMPSTENSYKDTLLVLLSAFAV